MESNRNTSFSVDLAVNQLTLPKSRHIRSSKEFARIYEGKQKAGDGHLLIFAAANELDHSRFGLSVSKKHGSAVKRNRLKRLLREAFRSKQQELPCGLDLVLIPRINSAAALSDFQESLLRLARKLARQLSTEERQ